MVLRRQRRGNLIFIVMAIMFVAVTLMMLLFQVSSSMLTEGMRTEMELEAHQVARFSLLRQLRGVSLTPDNGLSLSFSETADAHLLDARPAGNLFQFDSTGWSGLSDAKAAQKVSFDNSIPGWPGHRYLRYSYANKQFQAVTSLTFPFALMTQSSDDQAVFAERLVGWKNPAWGAAQDPLHDYASTPPRVLAPGRVTVNDMPCGEVLSQVPARLQCQIAAAGAVAYQLPGLAASRQPNSPSQLALLLHNQLLDLRQAMHQQAQPVDKTQLFCDTMDPGDALGLFFTQLALPAKFKDHLSLNQSQAFWVPTVPGFTKQFFIIYHLIFHIPDRPDGSLNDAARFAQSCLQELLDKVFAMEKAVDALNYAKDKVESARQDLAKHMDCGSCKLPWNWPCCLARAVAEGAMYAAEGALIVAEQAVTLAEQAVLAVLSPVIDAFQAVLVVSGQMPIPVSRADERGYADRTGVKIDKNGMDNWAYRSVFNGIGAVVTDLFSGNFDKVGRDFGHELNVVFFGQDNKQQSWNLASAISGRASLNVPAGRCLLLSRSLSLQGDLWLGRGSLLVIQGDLTMAAGDGPTTGRIFLEEGARLSVSGSIQCAGSAEEGSVMVGGPLGAEHPVTSAIFCGDNFTAPYGILPGVSADLIQGSRPAFFSLLTDTAPNLAKIQGPFHRRLPYIARFATTFEWIALDDPLPFVIPENFPNLTVSVFRGLSALYAPTLNFALGENFVTHCDWWGQGGEGRVPMFLKPKAAALANALNLTAPAWDYQFATKLSQRGQQVSADQVDRFSNDLCLRLAAEWAKAIIAGTGIPLVSWGKVISTVISVVEGDYYSLDQRESDLDGLIPESATEPWKTTLTSFWATVDATNPPADAVLAQECSGVLIYAGGNLQVGTATRPADLACGWFIAEGDIDLQAQLSVGAATSLRDGKIRAQAFYAYPDFTRVSLYQNPAESSDWRERGNRSNYADGGGAAIDFGYLERLTYLGR